MYLLELEAEGRGYHLIGHSHGGSVIWHTLCRARLQQKDLTCLRSWSTVGTPFLQHRTRSMWHVLNVFNLLLACVLLRPAYYTLRKLAQVTRCRVARQRGRHHAGQHRNGQVRCR